MRQVRIQHFECPCQRCRGAVAARDARQTSYDVRRWVQCNAGQPSEKSLDRNEWKPPKVGFFAEADTTAEVPAVRKKRFDINDRGGRYNSEFIWNMGWQDQLDEEERQKQKKSQGQEEATTTGFLSFTRLADLNDISRDLSPQLKKQHKEVAETSSRGTATNEGSKYFSKPPSQREYKSWRRNTTYAYQNAEQPSTSAADHPNVAYEDEKLAIALWTLGLTGACFVATYYFYTRDVAASYLAGAFFGLLYLRLLGRGVDAIGTSGPSGLLAQPRLLVPVVLVMVFNRWNALAATSTGVSLELLPMMVGFFTYKGAIVARQSLQVFSELVTEVKASSIRRDTPQD